LAQQKENEAEAALGRQDAASAKLEFQKAQQTYKQAAQEAERAATGEEKQRVAALQRQQSDAEQARAAQETKRASEAQQQVAMLTANVEQWRGRVLARREEAVRTEANRLAKDVFDAAQAKQAEAEGLVGRQNYTAASLAYQDAAERYMEATQRAQGVREAKAQAESARTRMLAEKQLAEKQQADPAASDFASGLAEEKQGNGLYERLAFREATEKFKSAETFFARAGVKPAPTSPAPPKPDPVRPAPRRPLPPVF
jgi:exonuclease SbcC